MSRITTHVLDTAQGHPAAGVPVRLELRTQDGWREIGSGITDGDGRLRSLIEEDHRLAAGDYRLIFETRLHSPFFPHVTVEFTVDAATEHYHVPLLLSPYGYSTYRGS